MRCPAEKKASPEKIFEKAFLRAKKMKRKFLLVVDYKLKDKGVNFPSSRVVGLQRRGPGGETQRQKKENRAPHHKGRIDRKKELLGCYTDSGGWDKRFSKVGGGWGVCPAPTPYPTLGNAKGEHSLKSCTPKSTHKSRNYRRLQRGNDMEQASSG